MVNVLGTVAPMTSLNFSVLIYFLFTIYRLLIPFDMRWSFCKEICLDCCIRCLKMKQEDYDISRWLGRRTS